MPTPIKLSDLAVGKSAVVREFPKVGSAYVRLREMGVLAGTRVTLIRTAPMGDPLEIKVRGYHLTLRRHEADQIFVSSGAK